MTVSASATALLRRISSTPTYVDILHAFSSAHPSLPVLLRLISPIKRREYSIASSPLANPNSISLLVLVVTWEIDGGTASDVVSPSSLSVIETTSPRRLRKGHTSSFLSRMTVGQTLIVSLKPSVMKLPPLSTAPLILAGLGTGLAPLRAFVAHRACQFAAGLDVGPILLYLGSRRQREEYLYGEEWEAWKAAGIIHLLGTAFSRDRPAKVYIQDRMRETLSEIRKAYLCKGGAFYLCGPTGPVGDITRVLEDAIILEMKEENEVRAELKRGKMRGDRMNARKEIERLKEEGRFVLEVY